MLFTGQSQMPVLVSPGQLRASAPHPIRSGTLLSVVLWVLLAAAPPHRPAVDRNLAVLSPAGMSPGWEGGSLHERHYQGDGPGRALPGPGRAHRAIRA